MQVMQVVFSDSRSSSVSIGQVVAGLTCSSVWLSCPCVQVCAFCVWLYQECE